MFPFDLCLGEIVHLAHRCTHHSCQESIQDEHTRNAFYAHPRSKSFVAYNQVLNQKMVMRRSAVSKKLFTNSLEATPCIFLFFMQLDFEFCIFKQLLICGPVKIPALNFASFSYGSISSRNLNVGPSLSSALKKFFIKPSFMYKGGNKTLLGSTRGISCMLCFPGVKESLEGQNLCTK